MKKLTILLILFSTMLHAQNDYHEYPQLWKEVQNFENDGLPKSANKVIVRIFEKAKADNNAPQVVKALLYQSKYALNLEEDAQLNIVKNFEKEIETSEFPTKNILENVLANMYWQYFQQNRWQFYERTHTAEKVDAEDFRTWDLHSIFEEIHTHFQNSLQNGLLSQKTDITRFKSIINYKEELKTRPTLYDFLAHNALDFYKTGESNLAQPAYKFELSKQAFLGDTNTFLNADFTSEDTLSQKRNALLLYKKLTRLHQLEKNTEALISVSLQRLDFVKENATFSNKNDVYLNTLKALQKKHKKNAFATEIDYRIALEYQALAQTYNPKNNNKNQFKLQDAIEVCDAAIKRFPKSNGAGECQNLKAQIQIPYINITNESNIEPNKESRLLVNYRNLDKLYFRVYRITEKTELKINKTYNKKTKLDYIKRMKEIEVFTSNLKNEKDYQQHTTEVILPKLQQGNYLILASDDSGFNNEESYSFSYLQATNIVLVEDNHDNSYNYQVVNRFTGQPLAGAKVHIYNENNDRYNKHIDITLTTDDEGFASYKSNEHHNRVKIEITHNDDIALFKFFRIYKRDNHYNDESNFHNNSVYLFTDRSIYRPSQTVYFKGITVSQVENSSTVISNRMLSVTLKDANYQDVKTLNLVTNEYGSFSGEFILPASGLTGRFEITVNESDKSYAVSRERRNRHRIYGSVGFSVEEYKRPKFEVAFDKVKESFKLDELVKVRGKATAYAGSNITDAKVVYRVTRKVRYPRWWYWYRPYFSSEAQEIKNAETTTNAKGEFEIEFIAQPDKSVAKKDLPIFNYEIIADITDINGETRSTTTLVNVGYHALTANINVAGKIDKKNKDSKISIETNNLNGEPVAAKGSVKIYKLVAPTNVTRARPWQAPDYKQLSASEFEKRFPHETYASVNNPTLWEKGTLVFEDIFETDGEKSTELALKKIKNWDSGKYRIDVETKDRFNQKVIDKQVFDIFGTTDKQVADNQLFTIGLDKKEYKIGDAAQLKLGSASQDLSVVINIERDRKIISTEIVHLNNEIKTISIPVRETDLGGFGITYHFVNYNSFQSGNLLIPVPYPKTELEIITQTFRDKLQPGQEETWSFTVKGPKGDKVVAEMLSSMYDASLDQFKMHKWNFQPIYHRTYYVNSNASAGRSFGTQGFQTFLPSPIHTATHHILNPTFNWYGFRFGRSRYFGGKRKGVMNGMVSESRKMERSAPQASPVAANVMIVEESESVVMDADVKELGEGSMTAAYSNSDKETSIQQEQSSKITKPDFSNIKVRTNFNETAFFFPHLTTDKDGNVSFSFTTPESLTQWKLQLLSHTKDLNSAIKTMETVTQKELMVMPNPPRFLREGDEIVFSTKIANISDKNLTGNVALQLVDAITLKSIDTKLANTNATQNFSVAAKGNSNVSWTLKIPYDVQAVQYKVVAQAGDFSDGEQNVLPVLSNRMLVTETLPMWVRSNQTKSFTLDKLKNNTSKTLKNHKLTLEVTSNPAWYAVQALPYLMEYPYECAEQTFSRYYANTLASHIANSNPRIQQVFNQWKNSDALLSNLEKNQELKSLIIEETPWLRDAQSETEQKKRIALLFDLHKMKSEQKRALKKLGKMQMSSGGFPWFKGSRYPNRYITQHIAAGYGHLGKLGVLGVNNQSLEEKTMIEGAVSYLDNQIIKDYKELLKRARIIRERESDKAKGKKLESEFLARNNTSHFQVHYLYTRSFFKEIKIPNTAKDAVNYYTNQAYKYWQDYNLYTKGMLALVSHRNGNAVASKIMASLKENSITSEELGMYWKENTNSYYWYQAPIETQALMIEAFTEVGSVIQSEAKNLKTVDNLKIWLLKNKQTNRWKTTKATTEAVYALLLQGADWLENTEFVDIIIGDQKINPLALEETKVEAGTGYYKTSWNTTYIKPEMADVSISKNGEGIAWGAMYWQYFEDLDKITHAETPLQLSKKLFIKTNEDRGEVLSEIKEDTKLALGDLVRVRVELKVDRAMEFIHMKDMRASGFEPVNVLSRYKYQDGLGYYESTKDAATHFFIDYLPKGVYVFEYDLRVNNAGNFSNGITTIQSMYAPEFTSHSEGVRVVIK